MSVVSRNFHNLRGRIHGPDRGFISCCCSPLFFFFRALEALESGGVKRGRMTVNQDALSPGLRGVYINETTRTPYYQN